MNTSKIITALYHAETALCHAFQNRRWDSERHAAKLLVYRIRNLRAALDTSAAEAPGSEVAQLLKAA